jgi:hypothetical protein
MTRFPLIVWVISLPAIIFQLGINIFCDGQTTDSIAPIPPPRAGDNTFTIPGCEVLDSVDCLVAKTAFGMPEYCKTYATTVNCITYLTPAFCGDIDLPAVQEDTTPLQNCIDAVPFGPCHYNATGRACTSGLSSAFHFLNDPDPPRLSLPLGGGPGREFDQELDIPEVIFGGELDHSWNSSVVWGGKADDLMTAEQKLMYNVGQFLVGMLYLTSYLSLLPLLILHRYIQEHSKYCTRTCRTFT